MLPENNFVQNKETSTGVGMSISDITDLEDLVGEFRFYQKKEGGEISKHHGHAELPGNETIIQQKTTPRAQEPTTVDPYATLGKFQLSTDCSLHTEVMTRKTPVRVTITLPKIE
ncbi:unnamed protein product [Ilex paraguariensis]|uniref:Uncharacterized protein n=1 Tax=Ilex paraguariensis TaxID=185542 RepID=A0ABC8RSI7_9AQUA